MSSSIPLNMKNSTLNTIIATIIVSISSVACTEGSSTDQNIKSAREYLQKNDTKSAVIQLKNALLKDSELGDVRLLLGIVLLRDENYSAAEIELRKALSAKTPKDVVIPELARAMLQTGQARKLIDEFGDAKFDKPEANANFQTILVAAYNFLDKPNLAKIALSLALNADPGYAPALIEQARQLVDDRDVDGALRIVDEVIAKEPRNADAWRLRGDIFFYVNNKMDEALVAYKKSLEINFKSELVQNAILAVLMRQGKLDEASKQIERLKTLRPNSVEVRYSEAQLAYRKKDYKLARELAQKLLRLTPNNPRTLQLMGAIELDANSLIQAESYLLKATQLAPGLLLSRRLLAVTYLRSGKPAKALEALNSGGGKDGINPILFSLAGEAYLQNGDPQTAEKYFVQALKIDPDNAGKRAALAVAHLATGKTATAIDELNAIASSDPGSSADFALISAHLQRNEFDKALVAIDRLEGKQPDKPMAPNLRGRVQMLQKDPVAARRSFERALAIEPSYFTAAASLAAMDLADKKPEDAKKRFQGLLAINPKDGQALTSLARLAALNGAPKDEVAELLSKAVAASPEEAVPRLLLIELLLRHRENKQALTMAQDAATALPNNPEILAALGRMHQVSGDVNQAISVYSKLISMQPSSPQPLIRLAEAYAANKDHGAAEQSLRKALEMQPDLLDAQRALIVLAIDAKKYQNAAKVVRTIQQQRPKDSLGFILQGDVASAQSDWGVAVSAYRTGMQMSASTELAIKLHSALVRSGNYAEGERFAIKWLKEQPSDSVFISQLAEFSIMRKEYSSAQVHYLSLLKLQPNNTVVLNNLAWVMGILKQDGAILYAEKANKLEPNQPILMDTLAVLLAEEKEYGRSIELLSKALEIQPTNAKIRLTLAKIYIKSGDKVKAKKELDSLSYLGEKFYLQPEVSAILKGL